MKKIIILLTFFILNTQSFATTNLSEFTDIISNFDNEIIDSSEYNEIISNLKNGDFEFDYKKIFSKIGIIFSREIKNNVGLIIQIMIIAILSGLLNNIKGDFASKGIGQIAFYISYIVIVTLIISNFSLIIDVAKDAIFTTTSFMNVFTPVILGFVVSTGGFATSSMIYPIIIFITNAISNLMNSVVIPLLTTAFGIGLVANISNRNKLTKLSKSMRSVIMWGLGIILTVFVGIVSLEGTIATTVDGITVKTAKFMFSNGVPVVGKLLGDSIDTILGSTVVLKDVVGIVGVIILLALLITPIIKILIFLFMYNITSILIQPIAESRIVKSLEEVSEGVKIVLALVLTVNIMFIIGIVSTLKMTNAITMFR